MRTRNRTTIAISTVRIQNESIICRAWNVNAAQLRYRFTTFLFCFGFFLWGKNEARVRVALVVCGSDQCVTFRVSFLK